MKGVTEVLRKGVTQKPSKIKASLAFVTPVTPIFEYNTYFIEKVQVRTCKCTFFQKTRYVFKIGVTGVTRAANPHKIRLFA